MLNNDIKIFGSEEDIKTVLEMFRSVKLNNSFPISSRDTIIDYSYEPKTTYSEDGTPTDNMVTTLTFFNGTKTTVMCPKETANQYTGFYIAVAKHYMGNDNTVNDEAEYWIEKRPLKEARVKANEEKHLAEEKARQERIAKKKRKNEIRKAARQRKLDYEAATLANEKFGVPEDCRLYQYKYNQRRMKRFLLSD